MAVAWAITQFALEQHRNFLTIACDSACTQCAIVNTLHGHPFCNNGAGGQSILAWHTTFILLLLAPIYALAPSVDTLFVLQVWGVYTSIIPLFLIADELLKKPSLAFVIGCGGLASPLLLHMALAPLHPETWMLTAAFWSYLFYLRNSLTGYCLSFLFAVCCGEHAALIYLSLGIALLLTPDAFTWRRQYGAIALLGGTGWLFLSIATSAFLSRPSDTFHNVAYHYTQWGIEGASSLPFALAVHPVETLGYLFDVIRWQHLLALVGLPLLLACLSWRSALLLLPFPVYFLMNDQEFFLYFHAYYFVFAAFAGYIGLILMMVRLSSSPNLRAALISATFLINIFALYPAMAFYLQMNACRDDEFSADLRQAFSEIPSNAAVYGPHRYSAYLSNRCDFVMGDMRETNLSFDDMLAASTKLNNIRPNQIDYIVTDYMTDQCGNRFGSVSSDLIKRRQKNVMAILQTGHWKRVWDQRDVIILCRITTIKRPDQ